MEENHYYPFGLKHSMYAEPKQKYQLATTPTGEEIARPTYVYETDYMFKYNGQEFQDELGLNMYAMDMRQYDPAIARWVVQDPVTHFDYSPYNAFDNNPVFWADPSGADAMVSVGYDQEVASSDLMGSVQFSGNFDLAVGNEQKPNSGNGKNSDPPGFISRAWSGIKKLFGGGEKGNSSSSSSSPWQIGPLEEPDWLNVNDVGLDIGIGVKDFKLGPVKVSADVSAFSLTYDKNQGGVNMGIGQVDVGISIAGVGVDGKVGLVSVTNKFKEWSVGTGEVGGSLFGVTRHAAGGSLIPLSGGTIASPVYQSNRTVDGRNPMLIVGGDVHIGVVSGTIEVNVDQAMSGPLGGSGFGDSWK